MNTFLTLLWLELRKFGAFGLGLLLGAVAWFFAARQIFVANGSNLEAAVAVFATTVMFAGSLVMAFLVALGLDFGWEYRAGRWGLLLGSPQPAWLHLAAKAVFATGVLTLFHAAVWFTLTFWFAQAGVGLPLGLGAGIWLYGLGGLALVVPVLFLGLWIAAYIPGKATLIALVVGVLGMGQVLAWSLRLWGDRFYELLPPWRLPVPTLEQNPSLRLQWESFPGLPSEGFVLLLALAVLFFLAASRLWQEVEA